jgi:outer membrane lipoprotein-sorting protein
MGSLYIGSSLPIGEPSKIENRLIIVSTTVLALAAGIALAQSNPTIGSVSASNLKDVKFTWVVENANQRELAKINTDFANSMRFRRSLVELEEPFKLRMESTVEDSTVIFIVNGPRKLIRVPRTGLVQRQDVSTAPGKRQTFFDFGLLTPSLFQNYFTGTFVRTENMGDLTGTLVYDVKYIPSLRDTTRHRIWVDRNKKVMMRREWYGQDGTLRATFRYGGHTQNGGVWIPARVTVYNADNVAAGTSRFESVVANRGIDDARFSVN